MTRVLRLLTAGLVANALLHGAIAHGDEYDLENMDYTTDEEGNTIPVEYHGEAEYNGPNDWGSEEFRTDMKPEFEAHDKNGDGVLNRQETMAFLDMDDMGYNEDEAHEFLEYFGLDGHKNTLDDVLDALLNYAQQAHEDEESFLEEEAMANEDYQF